MHSWGLVNAVVPGAELRAEVPLGRRNACQAPALKVPIFNADTGDHGHRHADVRLAGPVPETAEAGGVTAFNEKRLPDFGKYRR
jgi:naphthoate synthase